MSSHDSLIRTHKKYPRSPNFDSGIIEEPLLAFGGQHKHVDPKTGLALYGPYSLSGQSKTTLTSIKVGIVGPAPMVADAQEWLRACQGVLTNRGDQPFLYPHFPGFNDQFPFQCELIYGDTWCETIDKSKLDSALKVPTFRERIKRVINLYIEGIETLSQRDPRPDVILCCFSQDIVDQCAVYRTQAGQEKRFKISKLESQLVRMAQAGQKTLFAELNAELGFDDTGSQHQNLRRGLKAEAMQFGIPTQLIWPRTLQLREDDSQGIYQLQDVATRAWNFAVALYHKAGGTPWRLAEIDPSICFVGISFYREFMEKNPRMRTSMAQAFTSAGDGYVLRGNSFEWDESQTKSPHLDRKSAAALMQDVLELYKRQNRGSLPTRIVVHKSSRYWDEELAGLKDACRMVPRKDFVALGWRGIQFYRPGKYPPLRGTYIKFSDSNFLLYTTGFVPYLRTYPGARAPQPIEILEHHGDSPWNVVLQEILALTKLNWNTADFGGSQPITLAFSQKVGQILAELPANQTPRAEYRFYM